MSSSSPRPQRLDPVAEDWDFPRSSTGLRVLLAFAREAGLSPRATMVGTGLDAGDVLATGGRDRAVEVTAAQELRVVRTLHRTLGDVGALVGERYEAATFGAFGYAMLASPTVLDAMSVAVSFIDLSNAFALPRAEIQGDRVVVTVSGDGLPGDVRRFLVERDAVAVRRVLESLVPGGVGSTLTWGDSAASIEFGADQLDRPLPERSPQRRALAEQVCGDIVGARRARTGLAQDVRVLITQRLERGAPMDEVASALAVSERTLRRRLRVEGTGYQELLDEVRSSMASALLNGRSTMPVAVVAARLGYADAAALAHARARWRRTGRA
ncbi:AraC family transcriptional regulator [Nocardioides sp.]|jgi:AraC-like DNA-binding protein|uniref:AraC family transcriptional regulator n=1 Tax=Nocardioides sp. TaxID=35761 RepID=UPI002608701B|nr:AraC family transcriptional regulator [Nocardioides sp.]